MLFSINFSHRTDEFYNSLSDRRKTIFALSFIISIVLILVLSVWFVISSYNKNNEIASYQTQLEAARQDYYLSSLNNANLQKQIQDLNLKMAETINTTVELQQMLLHMTNEKSSLQNVKSELESGLRRTRQQLDRMQKSVNGLIDKRTESVNTEERHLKRDKDYHE